MINKEYEIISNSSINFYYYLYLRLGLVGAVDIVAFIKEGDPLLHRSIKILEDIYLSLNDNDVKTGVLTQSDKGYLYEKNSCDGCIRRY